MGIINREGALYMATGLDNSGLYSGRREAIGIIKAMASQITSFDVFSGIGISAATAFANAAKSSYDFEKEFRKNMLEVATISTQVEGSMTDFMNRVMAITQQIPVTAPEAAKALYQIVSAGHDGADGMKILEVSAKSAVGGLTDTATAADAITTLLNSYKLSADQAEMVSDQLFTTVRLGKTDFSQLGTSIAQVAPIAASYGVEIDQVLAAVASLTKSGTPTAQAMVQVRGAILSTAKVLGDGAFQSRTFQEALNEVANRAGGSESKLRELIPEVEAMNGILGLTGMNAKSAASDLNELQNSAGATEAAFQKMKDEIGNQMKMLSSNIHAILRPMGEALLKNVSAAAQAVNKGFETGKIEDSLETLKKLLVAVAGTFLTYKAAMNMSSTQQAYEAAKTTVLNNLKSIQNNITGESIIAKEKERVYHEAYNASLEKTITQEERATLAKLNLKSGSAEYSKTLSELALQEKKNAESLVDSLTKQINKNKEKLVVAQENLNASRQAIEAAKKEFDAAFAANDLAGVEAAQTKLNAAAKREEAAANNVAATSQKINRQQKQLTVATTQAETAATRINTATTKADAATKGIATTATNKLKVATSALFAVMRANPIGSILTFVSLATTAYMMWGTKIDSVSSKMKRFNLTSKSSLDATQKAIDGNADSLETLVSKYNELKKISSPTHEEQKTLRDIVKSIAEIVPSATTAIDQYNNALDINADKAVEYVKKQKEILTDLSGKNVTEWIEELRNDSKKIVIAKKELSQGLKYSNFWGFDKREQLSPSEKEVTKKQIQDLEIKRDLIFELLSKTGIAEKELRVELAKLFDPKAWFNSAFEFEGGQDVLKRFDEYFAKKNFIEEQKERKEAKKEDGKTTEKDKPLTVLQRKIQLTKELAAAEAKLKKLRASDSTATNAEIAAAEKEVEEKKKALKDLTGISEKEGDKTKQAQQELSRSILESELKLQSSRIAIMQDGKDKRVLLADQEYKETLATIQKEREEYQKKIKETKGKEDPAILQTFTDREGVAKNKRDTDVAKIAKDYSDQMKAIQSEVDSHFRSQLDNRLIEIDNHYKEQIKKAKEAGETEEGDFIQMLINKRDAEKEYARKESALSGVDFKEQVDLGNLSNSSGTYFVEETERQKTEILKKYALERIAILESMGDEQSRKESDLLKIAVEGYNKALSKPSKKSINTLVDEKAIKALQKHFMNLGASEEEAKKKAESFAETFQGKMQTVSEVTGLLKEAFGGISDELDMALDAIGNIAKGFAEGGLIGGISAAAGQLISVVGNLFTAKREIDKSMVEGYEAYMGAINELIDTQVALLDKLGGMAFGQNIIDTTKDIAKSIAASRTLFNEAMRAGAGVFSHSDGYKANKMLKGYARELREVGIYTTDLNRMTNEQLAALKKLPEVYARLPEGLRKYIDAIAEGLDKTEEFKEQIQDTVLGLDFTSIADMIVNSLTDPSIDNALEEFEANIDKTIASIVQNMLRRNMLLGPLEKMTADLYKSMEKKDKNGNTYYKLTADAARDFKENVLGLGKQFDNAWKELEEAFRASGIDLMPKKEEVETDASDNSLKGTYAKASEESIGLLAGQTGAVRVLLEEMKNSMVPIREQMQAIYNMQVKGWEDVKAIRDLTNKVEKNTDKITDIAERLEDTVGEISKDTRRSADALDGGTINTKIRM